MYVYPGHRATGSHKCRSERYPAISHWTGQRQPTKCLPALYRTIWYWEDITVEGCKLTIHLINSKLANNLQLAEELFGQSTAMIRIDGSEYSQSHSVSRLVNIPLRGVDDAGTHADVRRLVPLQDMWAMIKADSLQSMFDGRRIALSC